MGHEPLARPDMMSPAEALAELRNAGYEHAQVWRGDTLTDEQIRVLRDASEAERNSAEAAYHAAFQSRGTLVSLGGRVLTSKSEAKLSALAAARDEANGNYHAALQALGTRISWIGCRNASESERSDARARCAEILNARAAKESV